MRIDAPLPPWWRDLFALSDPVPDSLQEKIAAAGDGGLRAVWAVIDPRFGERPVPHATDLARRYCVWVLSKLARPDHVPRLLEEMRSRGGDDPVTMGLSEALAACGPTGAAAACEWFAETEPGDPIRPWLADVAAHGGVRSDESLAVLLIHLQDDPINGARLLTDYGDPSAVAALVSEFDRTPSDGDDADPHTLSLLGGAITALGGELDESRRARFDASCAVVGGLAVAQRHRIIEKFGFNGMTSRPEPGDDCPCGSGAVYEKCCSELEAELNERSRLRRLRPRP